jgi:RNA polymerase sigma factor (sigma-70 family)
VQGRRRVRVDEGFRALYEAEFHHVFRAAALVCGDQAVAEDATQEAFARAFVRWRRLRDAPWVAGWVTTTAINVARRQLRSRRPPPGVSVAQPDRETALDVRGAVRRLPSRQQEAVTLHYLLDLSVSDTASAMGCDEGTAKTHLARARATLSRLLEHENDDDQIGTTSDG